MIIVRLFGGLASQLHKYAVGRALALRHGTQLKLDLDRRLNLPLADTPREYELGKYAIAADIATPQEVRRICGSKLANRMARIGRSLGLPTPGGSIATSFMPIEEFAALPDNVYLQGEWVGDAYFADIRATLLADFQLVVPLSDRAQALVATISDAPYPVAIHVRRGDYISNANANAFHHVTGPDYYLPAVWQMRQHRPDATFHVFSDDPDWVAAELLPRLPTGATLVTGTANHEDLLLMSRCRGNIISSSGFGWMAAWLNENPDRKVIAPRFWVKDAALNERLIGDMFRGSYATLL